MDVDFTEKLIQEVRNRPVLYSINHPDYKNNVKKMQAWRKIQRELNEEVATLKSKWRNLKDSYKKYKQSKRSNSRQSVKKLQNWAWADHMCFIDSSATQDETQDTLPFPYVECENDSTTSTYNSEGIIQNSEIKQESDQQKTQRAQQLNSRKRTRNKTDPRDRMVQYLQNTTRDINDEKVDVKCDGVDLLFLGYADTFKKLSKRKRINVKFDIARIMMEAEISDLDAITSET